jgi:hypothetical protein
MLPKLPKITVPEIWLRVLKEKLDVAVDAFFTVDPVAVLSIFIMIIPFSGHDLLNVNLLPVPGAKPFFVLTVYLVLVGVNRSGSVHRMPTYARRFILLLFVIFTVSFLRSVPYASDITAVVNQQRLSPLRYTLSFYVKPAVFLIPFVFILKYVENLEHLETVISTVVHSIILLSVYLAFLYVFRLDAHGNYNYVRSFFGTYLKMHGNDIANFYILVFPVLLAYVFDRRNAFAFAALLLCIFVVGILYSRTAYLIITLSALSFLLLTGRFNHVVFAGLLVALLLPRFLPLVIERISKGFTGGEVDVQQLSAGRVAQIWGPLFEEIRNNPEALFFGLGHYGMLVSDAFRRGVILNVGHPHNMYLEILINTGLAGLGAILATTYSVVSKAVRGLRRIQNDRWRHYQYAFTISIFAYLVAGISGRTVFPNVINSYFWVVLGCAACINARASQDAQEQA